MMGLWLFSIFDYYFGYKECELKEMRRYLRNDAELNYGLNI